MKITPLNNDELDYLNDLLQEYGNDQSILDVSELDGFFTALVISPNPVSMDTWYPAIWGGEKMIPELESEDEADQLADLLERLQGSLHHQLDTQPEEFSALFYEGDYKGEAVTTVEEWCFGFMRGVRVANWPELHSGQKEWLASISLHGDEANFPQLEHMSLKEHQDSIAEIEPSVRSLYASFHGRD